jgi:hypothetical protein
MGRPQDRIIDGVDQLDLLTGAKEASNREGFVIYVAQAGTHDPARNPRPLRAGALSRPFEINIGGLPRG